MKSADLEAKGEERVAAEAWHDHLLRNRSVLVDLLQGQLRSQLHKALCDYSVLFRSIHSYLGTTNLNTRGPWTLPLSLFLSLSLLPCFSGARSAMDGSSRLGNVFSS